MILYYSGTGNSRHIARIIAEETGDELVDLGALIKKGGEPVFHSANPYVLVCPIYAWRIPRFLSRFLEKCSFQGSMEVYTVFTCNDSSGNAVSYVRGLFSDFHMDFRGSFDIQMPENYVAMFKVPSQAEGEKTVLLAESAARKAARTIFSRETAPKREISDLSLFLSSVVNPCFYVFCVHAFAFRTTESCNGCGKCQELCVMNNISLSGGKPHWGHHCTHCMACISACPQRAIEYGKRTKGKNRWYLYD